MFGFGKRSLDEQEVQRALGTAPRKYFVTFVGAGGNGSAGAIVEAYNEADAIQKAKESIAFEAQVAPGWFNTASYRVTKCRVD